MVAQPAKIDNTMLWGKVGLFLLYIFHACTDKIYVVSTEKYVVLFYRYVGAERETETERERKRERERERELYTQMSAI